MPDTIVYRGKGNIYLNITNRCSCDCEFCFRSFTGGVFGSDLRLASEPSVDDLTREIELAFLDGPADEVAFVGMGEPTMRLDVVLAVTEWLTTRRLRSRLVTNGHGRLLNPDVDVAGSLAAVVTSLFAVVFLTRYFRARTLVPFAVYSLAFGLASVVRFGVF